MLKIYRPIYLLKNCCLLAIALSCLACNSPAVRPAAYTNNARVVFQNSFETRQDSMVWLWAGQRKWSRDVPPGGGRRSLYIKGGRVSPTASMVTKPLPAGATFGVECWGKAINVGGFVELAIVDKHDIVEKITIPIIKAQWQRLTPENDLYCPPGYSLMLTLHAAATPDAAVIVDMVKILRASPSQ